MFKVNYKGTRVSLLLTLNLFHTLFHANFEQEICFKKSEI